MLLTASGGEKITNPSDDDIRGLLSRLDVKRNGEGFAILGPDERTYIQVSGDKQVGFDMEYQDGSVRNHWRVDRSDFSLEEVAAAMGQFRDGIVQWTDYGRWSPMKL